MSTLRTQTFYKLQNQNQNDNYLSFICRSENMTCKYEFTSRQIIYMVNFSLKCYRLTQNKKSFLNQNKCITICRLSVAQRM